MSHKTLWFDFWRCLQDFRVILMPQCLKLTRFIGNIQMASAFVWVNLMQNEWHVFLIPTDKTTDGSFGVNGILTLTPSFLLTCSPSEIFTVWPEKVRWRWTNLTCAYSSTQQPNTHWMWGETGYLPVMVISNIRHFIIIFSGHHFISFVYNNRYWFMIDMFCVHVYL